MDDQTLKQYLESRERELSEINFFAMVFDALKASTSMETREVLESYLLKYSHVDEDRVARYLEQFLSDSREDRAEFAMLELITLARTTDTLAHKILAKFGSEWEQHRIPREMYPQKWLDAEKKRKEFEHYLQTRFETMSEEEFFELLFDLLNNNPSAEARDALEVYLLSLAHLDPDRVVRYLEPFLSDPNPVRRNFTALEIAGLVRGPKSLASEVLAKYFGEELTEDRIQRAIMERFLEIFPGGSSED
ncbi:MAG TPA: hypothetical protein VK249_25150 [Anaerolineales bacterium]|nr:hypothetical protein [Anaerolineales bacterium]